jgi:two-component system response regulator WspF
MKIGIVCDLPTAIALHRALASNPDDEVVWVTHAGVDASAHCVRHMPDLVVMSLKLADMSGVEATRRIMGASPCAILMVTVNAGDSACVYEALGYGALDVVDIDLNAACDARASAAPFLTKLESLRRRLETSQDTARHPKLATPTPHPTMARLVVIGASAGGPRALGRVLSGLPRTFPAAIVIVQHVDGEFAAGLAAWLSEQCALPVRVAQDGEHPLPGVVLVAGTNDHLALTAMGRLTYSPEPAAYPYRPSVDVFFQSVRQHWPWHAVGVLLTGMGRDGAVGLKALRDKGWHTIAQDQGTSAVYGMPKAAVKLEAAVEILPIGEIAPRLMNLIGD